MKISNDYLNMYSSTNNIPSRNVHFGNHQSPLTTLYILDVIGRSLPGDSYTPSPKPKKEEATTSSSSSRPKMSKEEYAALCEKYEKILDEEYGIKINSMTNYLMGPNLLDVDVDGKNYKLFSFASNKLEAMKLMSNFENFQSKASHFPSSPTGVVRDLGCQILNIKDCYRGRFVRTPKGEKFIPYLHVGVPKIGENDLIDYGNSKTQKISGWWVTNKITEAFKKNLGKEVNIKDIHPIEYLLKDPDAFKYSDRCLPHDATMRKMAFGYYDEETNKNCLYFFDSDEFVKAPRKTKK